MTKLHLPLPFLQPEAKNRRRGKTVLHAVCVSGIGARPAHEDNFCLNGRILEKELQQEMPEKRFLLHQSVCRKKANLIAVSDGMGGHNAGEIASRFCTEQLSALEKHLQTCSSLEEVIFMVQREIARINTALCEQSMHDSELSGMGATLVMLVNFEDESAILNIGDSRAYAVCGQGVQQISRDHTEGQRLLDLGILKGEEMEAFPSKKHLNRYFGYMDAGYQLQADVFSLPASCERVLLCSDGVSDAFDERKLSEFLQAEDPRNAAERMVRDACGMPDADNATAMIIDIR